MFLFVQSAWASLSDAELRRVMIEESQFSYSKGCPCPYTLDESGKRCGERSAYSRAGGEELLCYPADISQAMLEQYRKEKLITRSDWPAAQQLIVNSRERYQGNCACPYSLGRDGQRCGMRSAYARPGGERIFCYLKDVRKEDLK